jgi:general secretion pathway protein G
LTYTPNQWALPLTVPSIQSGKAMTRKQCKHESGFTLIELMVVMIVIGVLMSIAVPKFTSAVKMAQESVLKEDLSVMRAAIDSYTMDKQKGPNSLDDLVTEGYLRVIPTDPITHLNSTWVTEQGDALHSLDQTDPGIDDVHSGSEEAGSDGTVYNTW